MIAPQKRKKDFFEINTVMTVQKNKNDSYFLDIYGSNSLSFFKKANMLFTVVKPF